VRLVLSSLVVRGQIVGQLPVDLLRLIDIVRQGRRLSTGEIGEAAGISRPTTVRRLSRLGEMGYVEWIGESPSDPRAFWQLKTG
jgi:ATP-dependent DNA helicase RecG